MPDTLSLRALNRARLDRQLPLRRVPLPAAAGPRAGRVIETVQHLVGLQAQAPFPPVRLVAEFGRGRAPARVRGAGKPGPRDPVWPDHVRGVG